MGGAGVDGAGAAEAAGAGGAGLSSADGKDHDGIGLSGVGVGSLISDDGGHAGMLSVGGSGGQTSVSAGGAVVFSSAGGQVFWVASDATALSGFVIGPAAMGASAVPGWVGTVCAHSGDVFCIGTAVAGFDSSTGGVWVFDHTGSPLVIGLAGIASASSAVSNVSFATSGVAAGSVCAQTGVVSLVGTAVTGFSGAGSGGLDCGGASGSFSNFWSV